MQARTQQPMLPGFSQRGQIGHAASIDQPFDATDIGGVEADQNNIGITLLCGSRFAGEYD